jgi:NAD(P)-dependent dehydrogenase (short-subunit alcohol dehydrogenase family)
MRAEPTPTDAAASGAMSLFDLSGRVALVTGGTRGLGLAISRAFSSAGARVVVASRKAPACAAVAAELRAAGGDALGCACHVGRWDDLDRLVDTAYGSFGRVDVLVNCAGISPVYPSLGGVSEDLFDKVVAVNFKGPFRLSALVGERMVAGDGGSIINVSSTGAARPTGDIVPYAAAKAAVNAMTVGFADALGPKVRVNAIMPGPFLTSISEAWDMEALATRTRTFALRRAGDAQEIVGAALYLASDASSYTTGAIITVDGGAQWSMPGGGGS